MSYFFTDSYISLLNIIILILLKILPVSYRILVILLRSLLVALLITLLLSLLIVSLLSWLSLRSQIILTIFLIPRSLVLTLLLISILVLLIFISLGSLSVAFMSFIWWLKIWIMIKNTLVASITLTLEIIFARNLAHYKYLLIINF